VDLRVTQSIRETEVRSGLRDQQAHPALLVDMAPLGLQDHPELQGLEARRGKQVSSGPQGSVVLADSLDPGG
jgi:hypothetical protein